MKTSPHVKHPMIQITFPDGSIWEIPTIVISSHRASYYAKKESGRDTSSLKYEKIYFREVRYTENNSDEIVDWISNNMNWSDISRNAVIIKTPPALNYDEYWSDATFNILKKNEQNT